MTPNKNEFNPCALVPVYNHGSTVRDVVLSLDKYDLPVILVDDGSDEDTAQALREVDGEFSTCHLFTHEVNQGKGGAVITGLVEAEKLGYTHALQVDADGQHDVSAVEIFLKESQAHREALVAGYPVYDESVPTARKLGRKLTTGMVYIETLSRDIVDAMCGFRMYPVESCCRLIEATRVGKRMDFDTQFLVKLHWRGVKMIFHPVRVIYPEGGISHFRMFRDNVMISKMHTFLVIGMIFRSPRLIARKFKRS
ncbi:MAG: glycosyltransferase family 2 protein [Spirochaetales bacterium]|nr:glycosyltransferase family 2 protein [Spirochaetales bacterium]